jgi:hypothetical protein
MVRITVVIDPLLGHIRALTGLMPDRPAPPKAPIWSGWRIPMHPELLLRLRVFVTGSHDMQSGSETRAHSKVRNIAWGPTCRNRLREWLQPLVARYEYQSQGGRPTLKGSGRFGWGSDQKCDVAQHIIPVPWCSVSGMFRAWPQEGH